MALESQTWLQTFSISIAFQSIAQLLPCTLLLLFTFPVLPEIVQHHGRLPNRTCVRSEWSMQRTRRGNLEAPHHLWRMERQQKHTLLRISAAVAVSRVRRFWS